MKVPIRRRSSSYAVARHILSFKITAAEQESAELFYAVSNLDDLDQFVRAIAALGPGGEDMVVRCVLDFLNDPVVQIEGFYRDEDVGILEF